MRLNRIVFVTEALTTGGAETFVLRLAAAVKQRGHLPTLVVLRGDLVNFPLVQRLGNELRVIYVRAPFLHWLMRFDGLLFVFGIRFSALRWFQVLHLQRHLKKIVPEVVHAHLLTSDLVSAKACEALSIPWISTMHGDYLALETKGCSRAARILDFLAACRKVEQTVGQMVCITDQQSHQLQRLMPTLAAAGRISKIYNGYAPSKEDFGSTDMPSALQQVPSDAFVIGMVARGVKDKGWDVLVGAFDALGLPDAWLVLVGDGDHLQNLRAINRNPRILFCGNVVDPLRYIARFDVACLPSQFSTESLPTVVIEYMVMGKPVIATAVGEIPAMLESSSEAPAGILIELGDTAAMVPQLQVALRRLRDDRALRVSMGSNALRAANKFNMDACVDAYLDVYARAAR
jgi:L-malate glycosyltransferase